MDAFIHVACIPQPAAIGAKKKTRSRGNASSSTRRCLTTLVCETGILQRQFLTGIARLKALGKDLQKEAGKKTSLASTQCTEKGLHSARLLAASSDLSPSNFFFFFFFLGCGGRSASKSRRPLPPLINKTYFCREEPEMTPCYQTRHSCLAAPPRPSTGQQRLENHVPFPRAASRPGRVGPGRGRGGRCPRGDRGGPSFPPWEGDPGRPRRQLHIQRDAVAYRVIPCHKSHFTISSNRGISVKFTCAFMHTC